MLFSDLGIYPLWGYDLFQYHAIYDQSIYSIYSINRPRRLLNFWTFRVGAYSRLGAY